MLNTSRPTIHQTLIGVAYEFAKRSTCSRLHVGAVIADHRGVILSSGYNGALSGEAHCNHVTRDEPCRLAVHAEANAILWAARRGISTEGAYMYCTHEPCYECSKMIIQSGIVTVYYSETYGRNSGLENFGYCGVHVEQVAR
ncbi:dCMP deaminase family protein [Micromonospora sp. CB01531]|uniref:dCMP deaminase family protein n=1 Tax=Micromonospora sp. CB01531 TaxID=1718947 RepID=UPI00093B72F7